MKVTIIGAGRLGAALALRSCGRGHDTRILVRSRRRAPDSLRSFCEPIDSAVSLGEDLILLAAPGFHDLDAEKRLEAFLTRAPGIPIASAVAYPQAAHSRWAAGRSYARFLCSPAVVDAQHPAILVLNPDAGGADKRLVEWFGPATLVSGDASAFAHNGTLLMTTTLHLALVDMMLQIGSRRPEDSKLLKATLVDAAVLLSAATDNASKALNQCSTPKGGTLRLTAAYREALASFLKVMDIDASFQ
jgi:hypothetical protein